MPSKLQARDLDKYCQLRRRRETSDEGGGATVEWILVANLWANIRPMRGGERFFAQQLEVQASYVLGIRNRSDILESDVIDTPLGRMDIRFIGREPRASFIDVQCELEPAAERAVERLPSGAS